MYCESKIADGIVNIDCCYPFVMAKAESVEIAKSKRLIILEIEEVSDPGQKENVNFQDKNALMDILENPEKYNTVML
jgi:autonomous glycyl radical cofactor GrcA